MKRYDMKENEITNTDMIIKYNKKYSFDEWVSLNTCAYDEYFYSESELKYLARKKTIKEYGSFKSFAFNGLLLINSYMEIICGNDWQSSFFIKINDNKLSTLSFNEIKKQIFQHEYVTDVNELNVKAVNALNTLSHQFIMDVCSESNEDRFEKYACDCNTKDYKVKIFATKKAAENYINKKISKISYDMGLLTNKDLLKCLNNVSLHPELIQDAS